MSLHYQTEYRMGLDEFIARTAGYQAFVAIFFDLIFGLFFELVAATLGWHSGSSASRFISWFTP